MRCAALLLGCLELSCSPPPNFPVEVTATTEEGRPFPGLRVRINGRDRGVTPVSGTLVTNEEGKLGGKLKLEFEPPANYIATPKEDTLSLLRQVDTTGRRIPLQASVKVQSQQVEYAVLVKTGIPNLPVKLNGEMRTRTNACGVALVMLVDQPGAQPTLMLSTDDWPHITPQNPTQRFPLGSASDVYMWEPTLTQRTPPPSPPHVRSHSASSGVIIHGSRERR